MAGTQVKASENLEASPGDNQLCAHIQMATGSGTTFTAFTAFCWAIKKDHLYGDRQITEDLIVEFSSKYTTRIAVIVDMIATGSDIKSLHHHDTPTYPTIGA